MSGTGHKKIWHGRRRSRYNDLEKTHNLIHFVYTLPNLPIAKLKNIKRRRRDDPRLKPYSTPRCIADWCWYFYNAGTRAALGINAGALARVIVANDAGVSADDLQRLILWEVANAVGPTSS
jgi:hypothetical protein